MFVKNYAIMKRLFLLFAVAVMMVTSACAADNTSDAVKTLDDSTFKTVVDGMKRPVVIDFSATWCGPCKMYAPTYHQVAEEYKDKADFYKVDIDKCPALANAFGIQAVPTTVVIFSTEGDHYSQPGLLTAEGLKLVVDTALKEMK